MPRGAAGDELGAYCPLCRIRIAHHREAEHDRRMAAAREALARLKAQQAKGLQDASAMQSASYRRDRSRLNGDGRIAGQADDWTRRDWLAVATGLERRGRDG